MIFGHVFEERGFEHRAVALAAAEQFATRGHGGVDPLVEPLGFFLVDHRADERVFVLGIAADQLFGFLDEARFEIVVDRFVNEDPLHADAALA